MACQTRAAVSISYLVELGGADVHTRISGVADHFAEDEAGALEKVRDIVTQPAAINTDLALGPSVEDAEGRLLKDLEPDLRRWAAERFTLHPTAVFHQPVKLERFWQMPWNATVLYCSRAPNPGEPHLRRGADKLEADWRVIETGHYPMLSTPDELVEVILAT